MQLQSSARLAQSRSSDSCIIWLFPFNCASLSTLRYARRPMIRRLLPLLIAVAAGIATTYHAELKHDRGAAQHVDASPDGRFEIVVIDDRSAFPLLRLAMPGQGSSGDSSGIVILRDAQGRELARTAVAMKQSVPGGVIWTQKRVSVVATDSTWTLPDDATPSLGQ